MSAAATAAGYLYASGRLRGRAGKDSEETAGAPSDPKRDARQDVKPPRPRIARPDVARPEVARAVEEVRVAALPARDEKPRRAPTVQYRTRRWRPEQSGE